MLPKASDGPHLLRPEGGVLRPEGGANTPNGVNPDLTQADRMELAIEEHRRVNAMAKLVTQDHREDRVMGFYQDVVDDVDIATIEFWPRMGAADPSVSGRTIVCEQVLPGGNAPDS